MENTASDDELWDDEINQEAGRDGNNKPPVRWIAYHCVAVWGVGPIYLVVFFAALRLGVPQSTLNLILSIPAGLLIVVTGLATLAAYHSDAKTISNDNDWSPFWPAWVLSSVLLGTPIIAPIYLFRRRFHVGPANYSGSWFDRI